MLKGCIDIQPSRWKITVPVIFSAIDLYPIPEFYQLEKHPCGRSMQICHRIKVELPVYRQNRESMESRDADSLNRYRLLSRYIHSRQQKAEAGASRIDRHADSDSDQRSDLGFDTANLVARKAQRLLQILIAEMRLAVYTTGRVRNVEVLAAELIQIRCLNSWIDRRACLHVCLLLLNLG